MNRAAGPSLDAEVAEKVFGVVKRNSITGIRLHFPPYSTDDAAALTVLRKMEERGYSWELTRRFGQHTCAIWIDYDASPEFFLSAPTLALACCLAALAAVEGGKG